MYAEKAVKTALELGADEVSAKKLMKDDIQIRFSNNRVDISNRWLSESLAVFIAVDGRTTGVEIKREEEMKSTLEKAVKFARTLPKNPDFTGLYDRASSPSKLSGGITDVDLSEYAKLAIDAALDRGAKRVTGEIYLAKHHVAVATNYNELEEERSYLLSTVRAFNDEGSPGQASTHAGDMQALNRFGPAFTGDKAGMLADMNRNVTEGEEGRFTVLFDPLCFGSAVTSIGRNLSAFSVDSGTSFFVDKLGKEVASEAVTVYDDPLLPGGGSAGFDDEAAPTGRTTAIENGVLKSYLHSTSTAKKYKTSTTGNARDSGKMSALLPGYWQMSVRPGKRRMQDIMADIKDGLYIANTWYTRFQDSRKGDFSTIPRDGIFRIKDGKIAGAWKGIRITENMLNILGNVEELSSETIPADWWGETASTFVPYALVKDVRITKAR